MRALALMLVCVCVSGCAGACVDALERPVSPESGEEGRGEWRRSAKIQATKVDCMGGHIRCRSRVGRISRPPTRAGQDSSTAPSIHLSSGHGGAVAAAAAAAAHALSRFTPPEASNPQLRFHRSRNDAPQPASSCGSTTTTTTTTDTTTTPSVRSAYHHLLPPTRSRLALPGTWTCCCWRCARTHRASRRSTHTHHCTTRTTHTYARTQPHTHISLSGPNPSVERATPNLPRAPEKPVVQHHACKLTPCVSDADREAQ